MNPEILQLIATLEKDVSEVVHEALDLWLKEKMPICPLTNRFCVSVQGSCNECSVAMKSNF
jgi:hypothetical protein